MGVIAPTDLVIEEVEGQEIRTISSTRLFPDLHFVSLFKMCSENFAAPISFIYRAEMLERVGNYDESLRGFGDWDFALRFLLHADIEYLDWPYSLAFYHQRPNATDQDRNSVFTDSQAYLENAMTNKYLREELQRGALGIGFLLSTLRKDYHDQVTMLQTLRGDLEAQSDYLLRTIREDLQAQIGQLAGTQQVAFARSESGGTQNGASRSFRIRSLARRSTKPLKDALTVGRS